MDYVSDRPWSLKLNVDLSKEEIQVIVNLMQNSNVQISRAEQALKLLNKFKEAANASKK